MSDTSVPDEVKTVLKMYLTTDNVKEIRQYVDDRVRLLEKVVNEAKKAKRPTPKSKKTKAAPAQRQAKKESESDDEDFEPSSDNSASDSDLEPEDDGVDELAGLEEEAAEHVDKKEPAKPKRKTPVKKPKIVRKKAPAKKAAPRGHRLRQRIVDENAGKSYHHVIHELGTKGVALDKEQCKKFLGTKDQYGDYRGQDTGEKDADGEPIYRFVNPATNKRVGKLEGRNSQTPMSFIARVHKMRSNRF